MSITKILDKIAFYGWTLTIDIVNVPIKSQHFEFSGKYLKQDEI